MKSREYTEDEVKEQFLDHIRMLVNYWDNETSKQTQTERLKGLAHSILSTIDGCSDSLPAFILAPLPREEDKQDAIDNDENYYPQNQELDVKCDIAGGLRNIFFKG